MTLQGTARHLHSAVAKLRWGQLQPPGALIRYLISDWPAAKRAKLKELLELDANGFSKLVIGACPISAKQAAVLAKMAAMSETMFIEMEENFSGWCGTPFHPEPGMAKNAGDILLSGEEINRRVASLALEMTAFVDKEITLIAILKGAFIFSADLIRFLYALRIDTSLGFIELKSYETSRVGKKKVEILTNIDPGLVKNRTVLIVDEVYDTGRTLECAVSLVKEHGAKDVLTCVLVDKPPPEDRRRKRIAVDHVGFRVKEDGWLVGYGMDDKEGCRGSRDILVRRDVAK
jgi:hypoxanthine phosphoribosyltransferase